MAFRRRPLATAMVLGGVAHAASNRTAAQMQASQRNQMVDTELNQQSKQQQEMEFRIMSLEQKVLQQDATIAKLEQEIQRLLMAAAK